MVADYHLDRRNEQMVTAVMKYFALACSLFGCAALSAAPELVTVGDAGNAGRKVFFHDVPNPYPRGGVAYPYRIGKSEVSNAEYAEFLNACAAKSDPHKLFDPRMKIVRGGTAGAWSYAPAAGSESGGVNFVSRVNAARFCNWLTTGDPEKGAYTIAEKPRENGRTFEAVVGYRDLTFPEAARVYVLPDMHEFFKAGWYGGDGKFRELTGATRNEPSHYGLVKHASGLREHMENKYHAGAPFVLGADDGTDDAAALNTARLWQQPEYEGSAAAGFRVAATAPLQVGDRLNRRNNFFFGADEAATLRIRSDAPAHKSAFKLELRDFADKPVWSKRIEPELKPGVTPVPVELPEADGYYELRVTPEDASFNGQSVVIPLAVMRDAVDNGAEGNFGFTCHITRRERRFSFEEFDFDLLRRLGVSNVRVDVGYSDVGGSQSVLRRIRAAGLNPLAIITGSGVNGYPAIAKNRAENPALAAKWAKHGVPADYAWYAEQVCNLISAHRDVVRDWEFGNEPTYWKVLPEDYAQMLKAGYKAAKLADPECNVMAGDLNAIHAPVFRAGGAAFCDSIASHIYGFYVPMFWGIAGKMREMNGWKNAAGIPEKPVWLTEIGGCTYSSMHMIPVRTLDEVRRYQAVHQPKVMIGGLAFGAAKVLPYNFRDVPVDSLEEEFGMLDRYGRPKPGAASYRAVAKLFGKAKFEGFVKGHSLKAGEIAGLSFRDDKGRAVVSFWRNDPYGYDQFRIPFFDTVRPPQSVKLKASGASVELFNLSGGASALPVKGGYVEIPVSEYPVFVRGSLEAELEAFPTAHAIPELNLPAVMVKILPNRATRSCDLMSGVVLDLAAGTDDTVKLHVYNLKNEPLSGTLRLVPKSNWREWAWKVSPAAVKLDIPGDGMGEASFTVPVPRNAKPDRLFYLDAIFETAPGVEFRDTVAFRAVEKKLSLSEWTTYAKGFRLAAAENGTQIRISWQKERAPFVSLFLRTPQLFAENAAGLETDIALPVRADGAKVHAVNLLFMDKNGEIFQLKQKLELPDGKWTVLRFDASGILKKGVIVHKGGDGKVDFPVRLLGFNFELKPDAAENGFILVKGWERIRPLTRWEPGAWTVYGEGYALAKGADDSELVVKRTPGGRAYASLFSARPPVLAKDAASWPKSVEISFRPEKAGVRAVSFLVQDATGETFQIKESIKSAAGETHFLRFDLTRIPQGRNLIVYGGNKDRKPDYPVKLLGFNFDFEKSNDPGMLIVNPPEFDKPAGEAGGGGAIAME